MIGKQLGDYRILEELGHGGMGVVYLAEHVHLKTRYALRVLPESIAADEVLRNRIQAELKAVALLRHPNIVSLVNLGEAEGRLFLVMEYVPGPQAKPLSLKEFMAKHRRGLRRKKIQAILHQIGEALEYAHEQGIVHRDLRPGNILVAKDGTFRLTGLGLSSLKPIPKPSGDVGIGEDRFSPDIDESSLAYLSPEQRQGQTGDQQSDLYALGALLYLMLTGAQPPLTLRSRDCKGIPERWIEILGRCMAANQLNRFASLDELFQALVGKPVHHRRKLPYVIAALLFVLGIGIIAGAGVLYSLHEKRELQNRPGGLSIDTDPEGAEIYLDGRYWGKSPVEVEGLKPGLHTLTTRGPRYFDPTEQAVEVLSAEVRQIGFGLTRHAGLEPPWQWWPEKEQAILTLPRGGRIEFVRIPAGAFLMGNPVKEQKTDSDHLVEYPPHRVQLTAFWIGKYEVTRGQWYAVMDTLPRGPESLSVPVVSISLDQTLEFIKRLNEEVSHGGFRLPVETEWEYACRAGTNTPFHWGYEITTLQAHFAGYDLGRNVLVVDRYEPVPVGSYPPNAWGLHDMHGNVSELCLRMRQPGDAPEPDLSGRESVPRNVTMAEAMRNPDSLLAPSGPRTVEKSGSEYVLRGGDYEESAFYCRAFSRREYDVTSRLDEKIGMRLVRDIREQDGIE